MGANEAQSAEQLNILLTGSTLAGDDQVEGMRLGEFEGLLIILGRSDVPIVLITQIGEHTVKFRGGIDEERLTVFVDGRSRSRELGHQFLPSVRTGMIMDRRK